MNIINMMPTATTTTTTTTTSMTHLTTQHLDPSSEPLTTTDDDVQLVKDENGMDMYIFNPYNALNIQIQKGDVEALLAEYGIQIPIHNLALYQRAFVHRSYLRRPLAENAAKRIQFAPKPSTCAVGLATKSNERIEFVGDGVLECITKFYLYRRFPKETEGFMTEKKIALVKNESIGRIAMEMGLHKWLVMSSHAEQKQTRTNIKKLGCLFEAFLGAIFLDFNKMSIHDEHGWFDGVFATGAGFQIAQTFVENVFERHVDWITLIRNDDNFKNILQVKIQKEFKVTPHYLETKSHDIVGGYHMGVYLCLGQQIHNVRPCSAQPLTDFGTAADIHQQMATDGRVFILLGEASHHNKKKAEQTACEMALQVIMQQNMIPMSVSVPPPEK